MTCLFSGKDQPRLDQQGAEGRGHQLPLRSVWVSCMTQSNPPVLGGPETGLGTL